MVDIFDMFLELLQRRYREGGSAGESVSPPPFSFNVKRIAWCLIPATPLFPDGGELTLRITGVGRQSGHREFKILLD
jgi:hypothetical protein